jgi:DNA-binding NtrC family response regulator
VTEKHEGVRVLVWVASDMQKEIRRQLDPIVAALAFASRANELFRIIRNRGVYDVVLLPAALPDADWWTVWGEIFLLNPRPAILVYAHRASFQLWSGVLESGGYDVVVEPFTDDELQCAVLHAAKSVDERPSNDIANE